jgi:hypothetical protein
MSESNGTPTPEGRESHRLPQWDDYLGTLRKAQSVLTHLSDPADEQLRQEAYRLLFLSLGQGFMSAFADPDHPDFVPAVNTVFNASSTNPDFIYYQASVDGRGVYRIAGRRGAALFVHVDLAAGGLGVMDELGPSTGSFDLDELAIGPGGEFEVMLSTEKPAGCSGDWRRLDPSTRAVVVRQGAYEWASLPDGRFSIERLDCPISPRRLTATEISARLERLSAHAKRYAGMWMSHVARQRQAGLINRLEGDDWAGRGGVAGQYYYQGLFRLEPGGALILETELPQECLYWNVQLSDPLWNTIDWVNRQSSLNGGQARLDEDGRFRAVISLNDPGVPNWLDPGGFRDGAVMVRWTRASEGPVPTLREVSESRIRDSLPQSTPVVSPQERDGNLRNRRRSAQLRRRW